MLNELPAELAPSPALAELLPKLLAPKPADRLGASEVLRTRWVQEPRACATLPWPEGRNTDKEIFAVAGPRSDGIDSMNLRTLNGLLTSQDRQIAEQEAVISKVHLHFV